MSNYRTDEEVRNYDIFKGIVTALLLVTLILAIMLSAGRGSEEEMPVADAETAAGETETGGYPAAETVAEGYPSEGYPSAETAAEATLPAEIGAPSLLSPAPESEPEAGMQTFTGMGSSDTQVAVIAAGVELGRTAVSENGTWEMEIDLPPDTESITLQTLDSDGNIIAATDPIYLAAAPVEPYPAESETGEPYPAAEQAPVVAGPETAVPEFNPLTGSVALEGVSAPGSVVAAIVNDEVVEQAAVGEDGSWQINLALAPGAYNLAFGRLDENGVVASRSEPVAINVPAILPRFDLPDSSLPDETAAAVAGETDAAQIRQILDGMTLPQITLPAGPVEWAGFAEPGAEVAVLINGEMAGSAVADGEGRFTLAADLPEGEADLQLGLVGEDGELFATSRALAVAAAVTSAEAVPEPEVETADTIVAATEASGSFTTLLQGLEDAGLTQTLSDAAVAYTLFAPTDDAFDSLPPGIVTGWEVNPEDYAAVLRSLLVQGGFSTQELVDGTILRTINGTTITINRDGEQILANGVPVIDVREAGNSVVYAVPTMVLQPLPAGVTPPTIDDSGVPFFDGEQLTVVGRGEPGERIVVSVGGERFGDIATVDQNGFWLVDGEIGPGAHSVVALMINDQGLVIAISPEVVLDVP